MSVILTHCSSETLAPEHCQELSTGFLEHFRMERFALRIGVANFVVNNNLLEELLFTIITKHSKETL